MKTSAQPSGLILDPLLLFPKKDHVAKPRSVKERDNEYLAVLKKNGLRTSYGRDSFIEGKVGLDAVILTGKARFQPECWGKPYKSAVYINPTVADLFLEMERGIRATGDYHHSFLEGITITPAKSPNGIAKITISLGS